MMFDKAAAREELLWAGYEDRTGLWEAVWWIQTAYPEMEGAPARDEARNLLTGLLKEGLVAVCLVEEDSGEETLVPSKKALEILARNESWEPPESPRGQFRFFTTEKGARPLFRRAESSS